MQLYFQWETSFLCTQTDNEPYRQSIAGAGLWAGHREIRTGWAWAGRHTSLGRCTRSWQLAASREGDKESEVGRLTLCTLRPFVSMVLII